MVDTPSVAGLTPQQWDSKFNVEYFQESMFKREYGTSENSIIQVKRELGGKPGDAVTYSLVNNLAGAGVTGTAILEGNEEEVKTRSQAVSVIKRRNAFRVAEQDEAYSAISLRQAGKVSLKTWAHENTRNRTIDAMMSINGIGYAASTAAQKDTWLAENSDRVLAGRQRANTASGVHATSLGLVDAANDTMNAGAAEVMKRMALTANPKIRPVMSKSSGRRFYTCYVPTFVFRDLKADARISAAQKDVGLRMQNEKLFQGGDIEWDGIIFKEVDDIPLIAGAGNGGIDVAPVFLCGAQALGYAIRKDWWSTEETFDYGDKKGVAINAFDGIEKLRFGTDPDLTQETLLPKDHGIVTGYFASVGDA